MSDKKTTIIIISVLLIVSFLLYLLHYLVFHDLHHIEIYFLGDLAFLSIEVLLVSLVIERLIELRDRKSREEKRHMIIGTFFSTMGTYLLTYFSDSDPGLEKMKSELLISEAWTGEEFTRVAGVLSKYPCSIDLGKIDLDGLKAYLSGKEEFMVRILENPFLVEHDQFSELLLATFHLTEELDHRKDLVNLPENDYRHLSGDICRVYRILISQWLENVRHLKEHYPYLFSLALRTNPFDEKASPIIP